MRSAYLEMVIHSAISFDKINVQRQTKENRQNLKGIQQRQKNIAKHNGAHRKVKHRDGTSQRQKNIAKHNGTSNLKVAKSIDVNGNERNKTF